jgi:tetratricopeptide (TPR) repeat protein
MKKRTLILIATIMLVNVIASEPETEARTITGTNGAILRQLPRDNTDVLKQIEAKYATADKRFEKQAALLDYYDRNLRYEEADAALNELIGLIKDLDGKPQQKEIAKWTPFFDEGIKEQPNNARRYYQKSIWERNFGSNDLAYKNLEKALSIDSTNINYKYEYAQYALDKNDYEKAIDIYTSLKKSYPRDVDYRIALAKAYTQSGQYAEAIKEYRVASAFEPNNNDTVVALNNVIASYYENGNMYDPMRAVQTEGVSVQGKRMVAFTNKDEQIEATQQEQPQAGMQYAQPRQNSQRLIVTNQEQTTQRREIPERPIQQTAQAQISQQQYQQIKNARKAMSNRQPLQYTHNSGYQPQRTPNTSSNKRVMVTYVNGRKVVRIVNINTETAANQTVNNAPETFRGQLNEANNPYTEEQPVKDTNKVDFAPSERPVWEQNRIEEQKTQQEHPSSYYSKPKYQPQNSKSSSSSTGEREGIGTRTTISGDPSIKALSNTQNRRPVMCVSYQNGKKVIKMVQPNANTINRIASSTQTSVQPTQTVAQTQTNDKKSKTVNKANTNKKTKAKTSQKPISENNTDLYIKANELLTQEKYQEAINVLEAVNPPTLRSLTVIASCYSALGQQQKSIDYYKEADKLSPNNTQILYSLGYLYYTEGNIAKAKEYVDMALTADNTNSNAQQLKQHLSQQNTNSTMNEAITLMNEGKYSESKKILEKSIATNPKDFQTYYYLGHIAYATNKYEEASRNFIMAIKYNPDYALSYYSLGLAYDKLKEFNHAQLAYERFLQIELDENKYTQYAKTRVSTIQAKK